MAAHWRQAPSAWPALRSLLSNPHPAAALRALDAAGLLAALLPEWEEQADRVAPSDPTFTAGERALQAIERLESLRSSTGPSSDAFRKMALEVDEPAVVVLALLLRETGAQATAQRIEMPAERSADLVFLVERQPEFPAILASRDVDNPATARDSNA